MPAGALNATTTAATPVHHQSGPCAVVDLRDAAATSDPFETRHCERLIRTSRSSSRGPPCPPTVHERSTTACDWLHSPDGPGAKARMFPGSGAHDAISGPALLS